MFLVILITFFYIFMETELLQKSLEQGLIPAIIILVWLIVNKIIDTKKESKQIKLNKDVVDSFITISNYFKDITQHTIDKNRDRCKKAIIFSFKASANTIIKFATTTIINNNIEVNKENILDNIKRIINSEYYNLYTVLFTYNTDKNKITDYFKEEWKDELQKDLINIIYNNQLTKEQKLYTINNKVNIRVEDYYVYITNKYIEHE